MSQSSHSDSLTLPLDAFIRSVGVNRRSSHALFLGAGASISSGVPSAAMCIWEWKRQIFVTKNPHVESQLRDLSISSVQQKIQGWLDAEGCYPPLDSVEEYSFYAEHCYPIGADRRQYFQSLAEQATPYIGYKMVCLLAETGIIKSVWTTNFDQLVARAAALFKLTPIEVGLDTTHRALRMPSEGELLSVALHGDYRYDKLKNTVLELRQQDEGLRAAMVASLQRTTLIVCGYSGRDQSTMEALERAYSEQAPGRLFWCGREGGEPDEPVRRLLLTARAHGREAFYVPTFGFDDMMLRLALHCLSDDFQRRALEISSTYPSGEEGKSPAFAIESTTVARLIKSNAFSLECPGEVFEFKCPELNTKGAWKLLRAKIAGTNIAAVLLKQKVLAFGTMDEVKRTFAGQIEGSIERTPISDKELSYSDSVLTSLMTESVVRALAALRGLKTDGRRLIWTEEKERTARAYGAVCKVYDAATIYLRRYAGKQYLVIKPTIHATGINGEEPAEETLKEIKRQLLTKQYNSQFNDATNEWRDRLFPTNATRFEFPPESGSAFQFNVSRTPSFASVADPQGRYSINLTLQQRRLIVHTGVEYQEPPLVFSNKQADGLVRDENPVRGIVQNQPYDYVLTRKGFQEEVRLGVICVARDARRVDMFLGSLQQKRSPSSKQEYLLEYPGFAQAFGLPLDLPQPQNNAWVECPEIDSSLDPQAGSAVLVRHLKACITSIKANVSPNVIVIYVPERWKKWESYNLNGEKFNLHDFIKAYCVQHGIATQFLREATFAKPHQCEVLWWLALSFYVKSMRTPWVLDGLDRETAFMGIGYSLDSNDSGEGHVVLGCSHIYNSEGMGLRYRLSKIEEPIWRRKNPYMSRDDARRAGDGVRQLFYESMMKLPRRVVIHKLTPFHREEREGLLDGLAGIEEVDMLEINTDSALRYVSSSWRQNQFKIDGFPVRRGTAVVLDSRRALVWAHGTVQATNPHRSYYQGKSRIPAPLIVTRHHGKSSLSVIAREMLGLSKMNWNTFDMYTKLPATIQSSNEIARIGSLLERFKPVSYDYRLFI